MGDAIKREQEKIAKLTEDTSTKLAKINGNNLYASSVKGMGSKTA